MVSILVIAIAWLVYRPLIGASLLVLVGVGVYFIFFFQEGGAAVADTAAAAAADPAAETATTGLAQLLS